MKENKLTSIFEAERDALRQQNAALLKALKGLSSIYERKRKLRALIKHATSQAFDNENPQL